MSQQLCLLWQNRFSRQWYHVGNLFYLENGFYEFSYENDKEKRGLKEALRNGYQLHPSFPDQEGIYCSEKLFSTFSRRLPNKSRPDYDQLMELNSLSIQSTDFEVLSATGGRLAGDNYEFVRPIRVNDNYYSIDFYVRGWRHYNKDKNRKPNVKSIRLEIDENNAYDIDAVVIKDDEGIIGFVPAFYSEFVKSILVSRETFLISDIEYNEAAASHTKVKMKIVGKFHPALKSHNQLDLVVNNH